MELEELKKSWNALDEHLKDKKLIRGEEVSKLITYTSKNIGAISRLNKWVRIVSLIVIAWFILLLHDGLFPDIYYQILLVALIPALGWDLFSARYLSNTKIDEMPLVTVIFRINRLHRWIIRERIIGVGFMLFMATLFFFHRQVWHEGAGVVVFFFVIWVAAIALFLLLYRKNLKHLREIRKNLRELKELEECD